MTSRRSGRALRESPFEPRDGRLSDRPTDDLDLVDLGIDSIGVANSATSGLARVRESGESGLATSILWRQGQRMRP